MNQSRSRPIKAWQRMFVLRSCPPDPFLQEQKWEEEVLSHVQRCPWCLEKVESISDMNQVKQSESVLRRMLAKSSDKAPEPGQIWSINQDLAGWGLKGNYINPPMVLILWNFDDPAPGCRVAQICPEKELAFANDILLPDDQGFAQAWNTYALAVKDLGYFIHAVPQEIVEDVLEEEKKDMESLQQDSTLFFFRSLEMEVSSFFTLKSLDKLLPEESEMEQGLALLYPFQFSSRQEVRESLKRSDPSLEIPADVQNPLLMVALTGMPAEDLALAAETYELPFEVSTRVLSIATDKLILEAGRVRLQTPVKTEQGVVFKGEIKGSFEKPPKMIRAWWVSQAEEILQAEECDLMEDGSLFRILFSEDLDLHKEKGRLVILVLISHGF